MNKGQIGARPIFIEKFEYVIKPRAARGVDANKSVGKRPYPEE